MHKGSILCETPCALSWIKLHVQLIDIDMYMRTRPKCHVTITGINPYPRLKLTLNCSHIMFYDKFSINTNGMEHRVVMIIPYELPMRLSLLECLL